MAFLAKKPKGLAAGSVGRIRLLHRGVEMDFNQVLSTYNFKGDYNLTVIDLERPSESPALPSTSPSSRQTATAETRIQLFLVNVISNVIYNQSVSSYSLVSRIIENLRATLNINHNIALFNENGILIPSQTIQANGVQDGDTVGILYYSLSGLEMLDLRDIQIIGATRKSRFTDLLRVSASGVIHRLLLSFSFRQLSDVRSVIMALSSHPVVSIVIDQSIDGIELLPDGTRATQIQVVQQFRQIRVSWNAVQQLPLDAFFSMLPQFSFSLLSTLEILNPTLSEAERRNLTFVLQAHNLPLYILINHIPFTSISSYLDQIASVQQSSQQLTQSLRLEVDVWKKQTGEQETKLRELVDANLELKSELTKEQENRRHVTEAEAKRKSECETLIAQIGNLNAQAVKEMELVKSREGSVSTSIATALTTTERVTHAVQSIQSDFQQLMAGGVLQAGNYEWSVRNITGAVNFVIGQLSELTRSLEGGVGIRSKIKNRENS
ncbi:hypothetical protein WA171_000663 [Blastocystis sp. BT1]